MRVVPGRGSRRTMVPVASMIPVNMCSDYAQGALHPRIAEIGIDADVVADDFDDGLGGEHGTGDGFLHERDSAGAEKHGSIEEGELVDVFASEGRAVELRTGFEHDGEDVEFAEAFEDLGERDSSAADGIAHATRRGTRTRGFRIDAFDAEARYAIEPTDDMTPERLFEQRWAWAVLDEVLSRLRGQYAAKGQSALFEALKGALTQRPGDGEYEEVARALGMTPGAIAVAVHRLRGRYRKLLRDEIAQTVAEPGLIDDEVKYLLDRL